MVKFECTDEETAQVAEISVRAVKMAKEAGIKYAPIDCQMDLSATHCNGTKLDFEKLAKFDDSNFGHDIFGIRKHLDRTTGQLKDCFLPRCSAKSN